MRGKVVESRPLSDGELMKNIVAFSPMFPAAKRDFPRPVSRSEKRMAAFFGCATVEPLLT
jgi:hypothetical protein